MYFDSKPDGWSVSPEFNELSGQYRRNIQTGGKQRQIPYRTLCYLCFESFKKRRTTLGIKKLSQFLCITEKLILEAHTQTEIRMERDTNETRNIYALMRTVNSKKMTK